MKTLVYKSALTLILLTIVLILPSCVKTKEIIKTLECPAWIKADAKRGGNVTLTWASVDGAVGYYIHCGSIWVDSDLSDEYYRIGFAETPTFSHYNKDWARFVDGSSDHLYYGVCMVDEKGNVSPLSSIRVKWPKQ